MNVLITGTSRGLGLELSRQFVQDGHRVFGICRSVIQSLTHSSYSQYRADIASQSRISEIAQSITAPIDIIINNAGLPGSSIKLVDVENDEIQALLDVNVFGPLNVCRAFLKHLEAGQMKRIVNISSRFGSLSFNQQPENRDARISYAYRISKAALNMFSVCMANEFEQRGISIDVIHPGSFVSGCGRQNAVTEAKEVASIIYKFIMDESTKTKTTLLEIGKGAIQW